MAESKTIVSMQAEIDALKAKLASKSVLTLKVSAKGAVSLYGLNARFPVTLYAAQWEKVLHMAEKITAFIMAHNSELARKE